MATPRLPTPGSDDGQWGNILNEFLSQSLATDGSLKSDTVGASQLQDNAITAAKLAGNIPSTKLDAAAQMQLSNVGTIPDGSITDTKISNAAAISKTKLASGVQSSLTSADSAYQKPVSGIPTSDLTTSIQTSLGRADSALQSAPVTSVATRTGAVTLTKSDVGLNSVDNTSDTSKPISSAAQTALNAKANASDLAAVATSGNYTDLINKPTIPTQAVSSVAGKTGAVTLSASDVGAGTYSKPGSGIPKTDLTTDIQTSLNTADSSVQIINGKSPTSGAVTLTAGDVGSLTQTMADGRYVAGVKQMTAPTSPATNDLWYDSTNDQWKRWNGTTWVSTSGVTSVDGQSGAVSLSSVYAPASTATIAQQALTVAQTAGSSSPIVGVLPQLQGVGIDLARYAYSTWYSGKGYPASPALFTYANANETTVRPPLNWATIMAAAATPGAMGGRKIFDNSGAGITGAKLAAAATQIVFSYLAQHSTNQTQSGASGPPLGLNDVESGFWLTSAVFVYLMIPSYFTPTMTNYLKRAIAAEADYAQSSYPNGQVWQGKNVTEPTVINSATLGNGRTEESSWRTQTYASALALNPEHAHAGTWSAGLIQESLLGFANYADVQSSTVVNGRALNSLAGYNIHNSGIAVNHGILHPDYSAAGITAYFTTMAILAATGKPSPTSLRRNLDNTYKVFSTKKWLLSDGFQNPSTVQMMINPPAGWPTDGQYIYACDAAGNLTEDEYYPVYATDGTRTPGAPYITPKATCDVGAIVLGLDSQARIKASISASKHLQWTADRQARTAQSSSNYGDVSLPDGNSAQDLVDTAGEKDYNTARNVATVMWAAQTVLPRGVLGATFVDDNATALAARYLTIGGGAPAIAQDVTSPIISTVTPSVTSSSVAFTASGTDNVGIDHWILTFNSVAQSQVNGSSFAQTVSGLTTNTTYSWSLIAYDAAGNASTPSTGSSTTSAATDTTKPVITSVTPTPASSSVAFTATGTDDSGSIHHWILTFNSVAQSQVTANNFAQTVSGLSPSTAYNWSLVAVDASGNTSNASTGSVTTTVASATNYVTDNFTDTTGRAAVNHTADSGATLSKHPVFTGSAVITAAGTVRADTSIAAVYIYSPDVPLVSVRRWKILAASLANNVRMLSSYDTTARTGYEITLTPAGNLSASRYNSGTATALNGAGVSVTMPAVSGSLYITSATDAAGKLKVWTSTTDYPAASGAAAVDTSSDSAPITTSIGKTGWGFTNAATGTLTDAIGLQIDKLTVDSA